MNPISQFSEWFAAAKNCREIAEPTAMSVATVSADGQPSVRILLLKDFDEKGFVFYTNMESRKSSELMNNTKAALCFYWMPLMRQVRIEGVVSRVSDAEADAYFATRPRDSQIGAWASMQSRPLENREVLKARIAEVTAKYKGQDVPRPPHWSGWRLLPQRIEFWQQGAFRLHDRDLFERDGKGWKSNKLFP